MQTESYLIYLARKSPAALVSLYRNQRIPKEEAMQLAQEHVQEQPDLTLYLKSYGLIESK